MFRIIDFAALGPQHLVSWVKGGERSHLADGDNLLLKAMIARAGPSALVANPSIAGCRSLLSALIGGEDLLYEKITDALFEINTKGGGVGKMLTEFIRVNDCDMVCFPGVPGEFACHEEYPGITRPTIMWDPFASFAYYGRISASPHGSPVLSSDKFTPLGEQPMLDDDLPAVKEEQGRPIFAAVNMPPWAVLAHEIGHFRQYTTNHAWFVHTLHDVAAIEKDNLEKHERPICAAAGLAIRYEYQDFKGGSNHGGHDVKYHPSYSHKDPRALLSSEQVNLIGNLAQAVLALKTVGTSQATTVYKYNYTFKNKNGDERTFSCNVKAGSMGEADAKADIQCRTEAGSLGTYIRHERAN